MKTILSYFEYQECKKPSQNSGYIPLPQDLMPFIPEEPIQVRKSWIHPREFARLFPHLARPRSIIRK